MNTKIRSRAAFTGAAVLALAATTTIAETQVDNFDKGSNLGGWSFISGADVIENSGGNPGGWLHNSLYDTFAPILKSAWDTESMFRGDYRANGVTSITFDARTDGATFGAQGREMSILLRNTNGTPNNFDDDDYAYFVGELVPQVGAGWVSYTFVIPSADTSAVPAGWTGGWAGDPENFRPGIDWNDVITNVDRVECWWLNPAFFAIFQQWDIGVDNVAIEFEGDTPCPSDLDGNNTTDVDDLLTLLANWGTDGTGADIAEPTDIVDVDDLLAMLGAWGDC